MALSGPAPAVCSAVEFEHALSRLIPKRESGFELPSPIDEPVFDQVRTLLQLNGKPEWAKRPRTYTLLFLIDRLDAMSSFVNAGLFDVQFPYQAHHLIDLLVDQESRELFIKLQPFVLNKARELEDGYHKHFVSRTTADEYFFVGSTLGSGRYGNVDHVISKVSGKNYARKRISRKTFVRGQNATASLETEIETLKRLQHPHLVQFVGSYTDPEYVAILITPVAECDLKTFLREQAKQQPFVLQHAFGCLTAALQYLHAQNCRHKDIKPANILVKHGQVLLTDFGTARSWSAGERGTTEGNSVAFTAAYVAPEVYEREARNEAADVWSLGCVFLEMLTVLKGRDVDNMTDFFANTGTGNRNPRMNRTAYREWLLTLQEMGSTHNEVIRWIRIMLLDGPLERINASDLLAQIRAYEDPQSELTYCGHCCREDESDLSSICRSSIVPISPDTEPCIGPSSPTTGDQSLRGATEQLQASRSSNSYDSLKPRPTKPGSTTPPASRPSHIRGQYRKVMSLDSSSLSDDASKEAGSTASKMSQFQGHVPLPDRKNFEQTSESEADEAESGLPLYRTLQPALPQLEHVWREHLQERLRLFHNYADRASQKRSVGGQKAAYSPTLEIPQSHLVEIPFTLRRGKTEVGKIEVEPLCKWIVDTCLQIQRPDAGEGQVVLSLCLLVLTFSFASSTADNCDVGLLPPAHREELVKFGQWGRNVRARFERFLRRCEDSLVHEVLKHPSENLLPPLDPRQAQKFFEVTLIDQLDSLGSITDSMTDWCVEFKGRWLKLVLDHQASDQIFESFKPVPHERLLTRSSNACAPALPSVSPNMATKGIQEQAHTSETPNQIRPLHSLRIELCKSTDCILCVDPSQLDTFPRRTKELAWHRPRDAEVIHHRTTTSLNRDFVNNTALKKSEMFDWICGIREKRTFLYSPYPDDVDDRVKGIFKRLQLDAAYQENNFNIVPGRLTERTIEALVSLTLKVRRARRVGQGTQEIEKDLSRPRRRHRDRAHYSTPLPKPKTSFSRPHADFRNSTASQTHRRRNYSSKSSRTSDFPQHIESHRNYDTSGLTARKVTRRRSDMELRRSGSGHLYGHDYSLDYTLGLVRKASDWFKKMASGRLSAPPHEKAGSREVTKGRVIY